MFILDLYRFAESRRDFSRQELSAYVFGHRECERLARSAGVTPKQFAACVGREFIPRLCTLGYLDMAGGKVWVRSKDNRPFDFELHSLEASESLYMKEMMNAGKLDDEYLFRRHEIERSRSLRGSANGN